MEKESLQPRLESEGSLIACVKAVPNGMWIIQNTSMTARSCSVTKTIFM
jgi:hypothetical protein